MPLPRKGWPGSSFLLVFNQACFGSSINKNTNYVLETLHYYQTFGEGRLFRDCQQITFVTLNGFCPLSNPPHSTAPPVLNLQNQDGRNTIQNQMKNTHPTFLELHTTLYEKKFFELNFFFFNRLTQSPPPTQVHQVWQRVFVNASLG